MRLAAAIGVAAVTWAAAVYIHQRHTQKPYGVTGSPPQGYIRVHPSWEDPAAVLLALGGLAVAAGILTARRGSPLKG